MPGYSYRKIASISAYGVTEVSSQPLYKKKTFMRPTYYQIKNYAGRYKALEG
jgi:hypothetical protein